MRSQDAIDQELTSLRAKVKDLERARGKNPDFSPNDLIKLRKIEQTEGKIAALMWVIEKIENLDDWATV